MEAQEVRKCGRAHFNRDLVDAGTPKSVPGGQQMPKKVNKLLFLYDFCVDIVEKSGTSDSDIVDMRAHSVRHAP